MVVTDAIYYLILLNYEETLPKSFEAELVEDIMSLVASTSSKVYGKRSAENRKKKQNEIDKIN